MGRDTSIEWCDHTFNPWIGCTKVSPGCDHCYAERSTPRRVLQARGFETWGADGTRYRTHSWADPLRWNRGHERFFAQHGRRQRVFCASLADVFDNAVPEAWRFDLLNLIADTPHLDWLLLTKRIGNAQAMLDAFMRSDGHAGERWDGWPNVWIGATVVDQLEAERDIPKLMNTAAAVRFLSVEPMLGPVDLVAAGGLWQYQGQPCVAPPGHMDLHWVICGGESSHGARPMDPAWARALRDQCEAAATPFFFKQWGEWLGPMQDGDPAAVPREINASQVPVRVGKKKAGRLLDGRAHHRFPLRIADIPITRA